MPTQNKDTDFAELNAQKVANDEVSIVDELENVTYDITPDKPFNACFQCRYFRTECSGPNLNVMSVERVCEFLQLCRLQLGYKYQTVADKAGLSLATVRRQLLNQIKDPSFLTIQALAFTLICDPSKKRPCALHLFEDSNNAQIAALNADLARANLQIADDRKKIDFLMEQVKFKQQQMLTKDNQLAEKDKVITDNYHFFRRKNRVIAILSVLLGVCVALIFTAFIVDLMNPSIGFFWM